MTDYPVRDKVEDNLREVWGRADRAVPYVIRRWRIEPKCRDLVHLPLIRIRSRQGFGLQHPGAMRGSMDETVETRINE